MNNDEIKDKSINEIMERLDVVPLHLRKIIRKSLEVSFTKGYICAIEQFENDVDNIINRR